MLFLKIQSVNHQLSHYFTLNSCTLTSNYINTDKIDHLILTIYLISSNTPNFWDSNSIKYLSEFMNKTI